MISGGLALCDRSPSVNNNVSRPLSFVALTSQPHSCVCIAVDRMRRRNLEGGTHQATQLGGGGAHQATIGGGGASGDAMGGGASGGAMEGGGFIRRRNGGGGCIRRRNGGGGGCFLEPRLRAGTWRLDFGCREVRARLPAREQMGLMTT